MFPLQDTFADYTARTSFERPLLSGVAYAQRVVHADRESFGLRAPARVDHQDHEARAVPGAGRVRARHLLAGDRLLHRGKKISCSPAAKRLICRPSRIGATSQLSDLKASPPQVIESAASARQSASTPQPHRRRHAIPSRRPVLRRPRRRRLRPRHRVPRLP
jgi:hypothetical protein